VGNHLNGLAEVFPLPLFFDDRVINLARRDVVLLGELGVGEALVVAQVEVGFGAVVGDEDFAVLERVHRAGIDVDVGIEFEGGDFESAIFEKGADRGRGQAFTQGGDDPSGRKDEFGFHGSPASSRILL
jgi:hypothetical protein